MLEETANFNPFGRGGGGAPLKDRDGNIIANLSQAKNAANIDGPNLSNHQFSSRSISQEPQYDLGPRRKSNEIFSGNNLNDLFEKNREVRSGSDERTFARGGNGIFGEGKVKIIQ